MMKKCCYNNDVKYFEKPNAGICDICHPAENRVSPIESVAMCPPIGEPRLLTMMAPVVFDECGINLCRSVDFDELLDVCDEESGRKTDILFDGLSKCDLEKACKIQLQVVDIDFNFVDPCSCRYSEIQPAKCNPNLSRITLKDIDVTFAVTILNDCCKVVKEGMMSVRYLGNDCDCGYDAITNPSSISFDLYTPYGLSYAPENPYGCNKLVPTINFMGYVGKRQGAGECGNCINSLFEYPINNTISQGVSAQALAKVVGYDDDSIAIGLTLYIKSIYFVQYKFKHEGLTIPPKLSPAEDEENGCLEFVEGDLLEASIKPLEVGRSANTIKEHDCGCGKNEDTSCTKTCCTRGACSKAAAIN